MTPAPLRARFASHLSASGLLAGPAHVLLAVSGGPDSLALLDLVAGVAKGRGLDLLVVHADHGIHESSAAVAARVALVARQSYGLETIVASLGLGPDAAETAARDARYAFFRQVQAEREAQWIVTGHHADDQAETVLLRLLRGSAPPGLAGIAASAAGLVRPLLPFRHEELVEHVRSLGIEFFEDPANQDERHMRSWVRRAVLPLLRQRLGDAASDSLLAVAGHAADEVRAWDAALDALPGLQVAVEAGRASVARTPLGGYDSLLAGRLVRAAAHRAGIRLGPTQALRVAEWAPGAPSGKSLDLGEGATAEASFDRLILRGDRGDRGPEGRTVEGLEGPEGDRRFGDFALRWRTEEAPEKLARDGWTTWVEPGRLEVRLPESGTRIIPLGGVGHRAVTRLLMEQQVPRAERTSWPLVMRDGEAVWLPGVCRADVAVPRPGTLAVRLDAAQAR